MRRRSRGRLGISGAVDKSNEISSSLTSYYASVVLFGLCSIATLPAAIIGMGVYDWLIFIFVTAIFVQSMIGLSKLKIFRLEFQENPEAMASREVPKPLLYRAIFWYLPK